MKTIGERVKEKRIELGMSQDELAKKLGYKSRSSINKIELSRDLPLKKISEFAKVLGCSEAYLMGWEEINFNSSSGNAEITDNKITISFQSEVDRDYYDKIYKLLTDTSKRKILSKFIDSLMEDD